MFKIVLAGLFGFGWLAAMTGNRGPYKLIAFVCDEGCVKRVKQGYGTRTFRDIYVNRPDDCRYAVATQWNPVKHEEEVIVWDLYEATTQPLFRDIQAPQPTLIHHSVEAAIAATLLLYEDD
jgi:hypothetical protein